MTPGNPCNVEGVGGDGTIFSAAMTEQCKEGSPGMSICRPRSNVTVVCSYVCSVKDANDKAWPFPQSTLKPQFELAGTNCGVVLPPPY